MSTLLGDSSFIDSTFPTVGFPHSLNFFLKAKPSKPSEYFFTGEIIFLNLDLSDKLSKSSDAGRPILRFGVLWRSSLEVDGGSACDGPEDEAVEFGVAVAADDMVVGVEVVGVNSIYLSSFSILAITSLFF